MNELGILFKKIFLFMVQDELDRFLNQVHLS
jgi:hypothetical protein